RQAEEPEQEATDTSAEGTTGDSSQETEQEYENREIEVVTRQTIQDRINYYEGVLANQTRREPVLTTISREDARRYQEINRQRAEREAYNTRFAEVEGRLESAR